MNEINTLGIDLAKHVFHVHGQDPQGNRIVNKRLKSRKKLSEYLAKLPACVVAMEACWGSQHWARLAQSYGHEVRVLSPQYVKAFARGNKTDERDAYAICEAAQRPQCDTVRIKSLEEQRIQMVLRLRERVMGNKVELMNQTRGLLSDYGITIPQGTKALKAALHEVGEGKYPGLQGFVYQELMVLYEELLSLEGRIERYTRILAEYAKTNDACQRLMTIPGIGPISSVALVSKVGDCEQFKNGKKLAFNFHSN